MFFFFKDLHASSRPVTNVECTFCPDVPLSLRAINSLALAVKFILCAENGSSRRRTQKRMLRIGKRRLVQILCKWDFTAFTARGCVKILERHSSLYFFGLKIRRPGFLLSSELVPPYPPASFEGSRPNREKTD